MNRKGFTLIELLAVLVILVVIMAIARPSVTSFSPAVATTAVLSIFLPHPKNPDTASAPHKSNAGILIFFILCSYTFLIPLFRNTNVL